MATGLVVLSCIIVAVITGLAGFYLGYRLGAEHSAEYGMDRFGLGE